MNNDIAQHLKKRDTTAEDRRSIFFACRMAMVDGKLRKGFLSELASELGFERKTISRQWKQMSLKMAPLLNNQNQENHASIIRDNAHILFGTGHSSRRKGKYKYDREELKATVAAVPQKQRQSVRGLASVIGIPQTTVQDFLKPPKPKPKKDADQEVKILRRHSSALKPKLTEMNKLERFHFALDKIKATTTHLQNPTFDPQFNKVHINEKWFHLTRDGERYILVDGEEAPKRTT
jgi:hypothetical protein